MKRMAGFTLVELLVVITIIGITMGAAFAGYRTFNARQIVITSGKELMVELRQAQSGASSGTKTPTACSGTRLIGHRVQAVAGSLNTYSIYEVYQSACVAGSTYLVKTVRLPTGVSFSGAFSITFLGQSGGVTLSAASPQTIRLCNRSCGAGAVNYSVSVSNVGSLQDLGVS